ncbi:MAG TPA: PAS domain S-box protein, partial [Nodosilinea sp.]|nr:PAS domain S-box protein [Nodosilinea sp.]
MLRQHDQEVGQVLAVRPDGPILELGQADSLRLILIDTGPPSQPPDQPLNHPPSTLPHQPQLEGLIRPLKAHLGDRCPPIIAVGHNDAELAAQALKAGATDYWVGEQITAARLRQALEAPQTAQADLDAFRVKLADALRSLADPIDIQITASRILGEYLNANRVVYFECQNYTYCVERDYVNGVDTIAGCYPVAEFGPAIFTEFCAGRTVVVADVAADPQLSPAERATYASVQNAAHIGVPLVKNGDFVAGLAVHSATPRPWTQAEINLAEDTAERTWAAVERARAEAALRQSEEKYRTLFQNIDEGFCLLEMIFDDRGQAVDFRYLETNPAFVNHAGQPMAGKRIRELVPNFEQIWIDTYGQVALTGEPMRLEHVVKGLGDQWFETYAFRYGGEGSRIVAVLFTNVTDRKQTQEKLTRELSRSKALLEGSSDGIVVLNRQGYVVAANESYARMLGRTLKDTLTLHVTDWDAQWSPAELDRIVASRLFVGHTFETVHRRQDGSTYNVEITVSAVDTEDEFLQLCICRDISERKRREANAAFLAEITADLSRLTAADEIMQTIGAKLGAYLQLSACA